MVAIIFLILFTIISISIVRFMLKYGKVEDDITTKKEISSYKPKDNSSQHVEQINISIRNEAIKIASKIKAYSQIKNLEKRYERVEEKRIEYDFKTDRAEVNNERKYEVLSEALDIASEKHLRFYYFPQYDINTPLEKLNKINKIVSIENFDKIKDDPDFIKKDWIGLGFYEELEELDDDLIFLKKVRKIIENNKLSKEEIIKKIDNLVIKNREVAEEFFDLDDDESAGEQCVEMVRTRNI